jgi:N-acetylglucosaminyl-diphospho-decaprenol L-rhamnosyltransferase
VPVVTGCLLLVPRETFLEIGGMDERFFLYGEDAEFSIRAARHGLRPVIVPAATIIHAVGASTGARGPKMSMVMAGKVTMYRSIWSPGRARIAVALTFVGVWLRSRLEAAANRGDRMWTHVWQTRERWLPGYPEAERTLFGLEAAR